MIAFKDLRVSVSVVLTERILVGYNEVIGGGGIEETLLARRSIVSKEVRCHTIKEKHQHKGGSTNATFQRC
jgi:hypothetical protein